MANSIDIVCSSDLLQRLREARDCQAVMTQVVYQAEEAAKRLVSPFIQSFNPLGPWGIAQTTLGWQVCTITYQDNLVILDFQKVYDTSDGTIAFRIFETEDQARAEIDLLFGD